MRKIIIFLFCFSLIYFIPLGVFAEDINLITGAVSGLLMEVDTGKIIFEKDIDKLLHGK